ncbi:class I SAM-dependent methyltransferase [Limnohabitans sp. Jir72]|uniref:methyltransferase n=1 Tax=Limnohabitans sp. Jir72 TaxID=1977909 RepID=UPI000D361393|nr:class I SAM-dependent methyltransferase [Limnohabitans sp. Jir72]PUE34428.1 methylase [Limnohabitans sp. Jir72]
MNIPTLLTWSEKDTERSALWRSDQNLPARVVLADDTLTADAAYRLACEGTGLLWRGDFHNARQLLQAMARRIDKPQKVKRKKADATAPVPGAAFHTHRQAQAQRTRVLSQILIELNGDYGITLRRAPDAKQACTQAFGAADGQTSVISLRALQGVIGAFEWRKNGVEVPALGEDLRIHPHYGVFSPVRGEYVGLVAKAPLPAALKEHSVAFDIGVGTGVLSAVLARRGASQVVATDMAERALVCARDNLQRLGLQNQVQLLQADLFPPGQAALVVCNPPWLPARPTSVLEQAVYDEGSQMLKGFLGGLKAHLCEGGEGWLILSDLAELLGLRTREALLGWIQDAGLQVLGRTDVKPVHGKAQDATDPLHAARAAEVTSLWRLGV